MSLHVAFVLAGQLGLGFSAKAQVQAGRRVALVIGNSEYDGSGAMALTNPRNDASDVANALEQMNFKVLRKFDLKKGDLDKALADFEQESSTASVALFYYAGHAMHYGDQSYLMPIGTKLEGRQSIDFQMTSVEDDVIHKALRDVPLKIVILDACRDNPVAERYALNFAKHRSIGDVRGLAPIAPADGLLVAYATAPNMFAEDGSGRNSPYTSALLRHMSVPGIEIRAMLDDVTADVERDTGQRQKPQYSVFSTWSGFFLMPGASDETTWNDIKSSKDIAKFKEFVKRYPNSKYRLVADEWIDVLNQATAASAAKDAAEKEQAEQDKAAKAAAVQEQAAREREAQAQAAQAMAIKDAAARDMAAKQAAARAQAARDDAERREAARELEARAQAARELESKQAAERDASAKLKAEKAAAAQLAAEKDAAEQAAAAKSAAIREAAAIDAALKAAQAQAAAARDAKFREAIAQEAAERVALAKKHDAKLAAEREAQAQKKASMDAAKKEAEARETAARETTAREVAAKEAARQAALAKQAAERELAAKDQSTREAAAKQQAAEDAKKRQAAVAEGIEKKAIAEKFANQAKGETDAAIREAKEKQAASQAAATSEAAAKEATNRAARERRLAAKEAAARANAARLAMARTTAKASAAKEASRRVASIPHSRVEAQASTSVQHAPSGGGSTCIGCGF